MNGTRSRRISVTVACGLTRRRAKFRKQGEDDERATREILAGARGPKFRPHAAASARPGTSTIQAARRSCPARVSCWFQVGISHPRFDGENSSPLREAVETAATTISLATRKGTACFAKTNRAYEARADRTSTQEGGPSEQQRQRVSSLFGPSPPSANLTPGYRSTLGPFAVRLGGKQISVRLLLGQKTGLISCRVTTAYFSPLGMVFITLQ